MPNSGQLQFPFLAQAFKGKAGTVALSLTVLCLGIQVLRFLFANVTRK